MRRFLTALALAGALLTFGPALATEPPVRLTQLSRDVTDAVRKQRGEQHEQARPDNCAKRRGQR